MSIMTTTCALVGSLGAVHKSHDQGRGGGGGQPKDHFGSQGGEGGSMKRSHITQSQKFDKILENFASKKAIFGHFGLILRQNLSFINHVIFRGGEGG